MDGEVPDYLAAGVSRHRDGSLRSLDDYYLTHELLELLHHADAGAGSSVPHGPFVDEKPSLNFLPPPSSAPLLTHYVAAADSSARAVPSETEMASWLCQVFEQEASDLPDPDPRGSTTTTTKSEGESAVGISSSATGNRRAASEGTPAERPRSGGRRKSCSGKAAEQRRRDKINDRMRTLQQLMPRCSKTDKASTLEEAIQYVKSLQHQLQVLSARGSAMPTAATILPPAVVPLSCMQLATPDVLSGQALTTDTAPLMLPPYPFVPAVLACPHHGHGTPQPPTYRYPVGSGSATQQQQLAQRRHSNDLAVPSHRTSHRE